MPKSHQARATDAEYMEMILATMREKGSPMSHTAIRDSVHCCHRKIKVFMTILERTGKVESLEMRDAAHRVREHYCIAGTGPKVARSGPQFIDPTQTLARFREAVHAALMTGIDPFRIVAA